MAKGGSAASVEKALAELREAARQPRAEASKAALRTALAAKANVPAARAAEIVATAGLEELVPAMEEAFARFMRGDDKGCLAKAAIARGLYEMGAAADGVFVPGVRHVQREASFGGPSDVAAELRGLCALGLVRIGHRSALVEAADLLADREAQARVAAARALAYSGRPEAVLLLRLKALSGDGELDVVAECLTGVAKLMPAEAPEFLDRFLDHPDEAVALAAGLALAESRRPEAFQLLLRRWEADLDPHKRHRLLTPIAMLRIPAALDFLLEQIEHASRITAAAAIEALGIYRRDDALRDRVRQASLERDEEEVRRALHKHFAVG